MNAQKFLPIVFASLFLFFGCSKHDDFYLSSTVFQEDPLFPGLPIYSEFGYNTFGAYLDRTPFVSTSDLLPAKVIVNSDTLSIIFKGVRNNRQIDLTFSFKGYSPQDEWELDILHQTNIDLSAQNCQLTLKMEGETKVLNVFEGQFEVKRVQKLIVDQVPNRMIISGLFRFKTFLDNEPITVSNGRFDLGIGYDNFFRF